MNYESVIPELFAQVPELEVLYREQFSYLDDEDLPYVMFGSFLVPVLEIALKSAEVKPVGAICAYLERLAENASEDPRLHNLLGIEIGEWLNGTSWEAEVAPYLGEQTKRICRYVPGLGTQRDKLRKEQASRNLMMRLLDHLSGR